VVKMKLLAFFLGMQSGFLARGAIGITAGVPFSQFIGGVFLSGCIGRAGGARGFHLQPPQAKTTPNIRQMLIRNVKAASFGRTGSNGSPTASDSATH
jgi:hypothetical protein